MTNNVLNDYLNALQSTELEEEEKRKESPHFVAAYSAYQNSMLILYFNSKSSIIK